MIMIALALAISLKLLVIAPKPNVLATPATVVEWQIRAWWSQVFVPHRAANFRNR